MDAERLDAPERLGEVTVPSGILVVLDAGLLNFWCHDRPPVLPEGTLETAEAMAEANNAVELRLEGPDARAAGVAYDRSCHPLYVFDVPRSRVGERIGHFADFAREYGFDAKLVPLDGRISHRQRISEHLRDGVAANGISFHGIWAGVVGGIPGDRRLPVFGRRRAAGSEFAGRWHEVYLELEPGPVARSALHGHAAVDEARLIFADAEALGAWVHGDTLDGKADFAFWGADAEAAARETGAGRLDENTFGWYDLPIGEAADRGAALEQLREVRGWRFATDFRPHSHHWRAMEQVRASATESGVVEVGGADLCLFMTSWGDGLFEVFADTDAAGRLVRVRVALGSERTLERMRAVEERYFGAFAKMALVSRRVFEEGRCARFLYREAPDRDQDSGWRLFAGDESDAYANDAQNVMAVPLRDVVARDSGLEAVLREPVGAVFERANCGDDFHPVVDWQPGDG